MTSQPNAHGDPKYRTALREWERRTPLLRRLSGRAGLQGRLVVCFMSLLAAALGGSSYFYLRQSSAQLEQIIGEQARTLASALALGSRHAMQGAGDSDGSGGGDLVALRRAGQELLEGRNILFVGFLDADGRPLALASRDPGFRGDDLTSALGPVASLMQVRRDASPAFGEYLEVVAPVLSVPDDLPDDQTRLVGYVAVGVSQSAEQAALRLTTAYVMLIGTLVAVCSLPMAYVLVHRVFHPIRQLVNATRRIAAGDLDHRVAIDRPDVIGTLARAFNDMVLRVRRQQQALEAANDQLEQANRQLEEKVRQRTAQLEAANRRLSSEIAEKEDFLRAVSHDLNAPLRNIAGMATMLLMKHRDRFDDEVVHRLERIQRNVRAETDLIAELLELSRIKTRRQKLEPVEVTALLAELIELFDNDLRTRGISVILDTPMPVLNCERARLRQVFLNLIDNAIKYMGDGPHRRIHVGCRPRLTEAEFYVRDTGVGIEPDDLGKVFFVFRRGRSASARGVAGKGVGLASVKSIIETYNGTIWVESRPGHGSTFRFTINGMHVVAPGPAPSAGAGNGAFIVPDVEPQETDASSAAAAAAAAAVRT